MELKTIQIKDLGQIITGKTPPTSKRELYGDEYPFIKARDMLPDCRYIGKTEESLSQKGWEAYKNKLLPKNTTCVVTIGTLGKLCLTKEPCFCNQAINAIVPSSQSDNFYVFYLMKTIIEQLRRLDSGTASGRENVSKNSFESIKIKVPNLENQRKIAAILSAYDDLIENNTRRIEILEEMARSLYREWFVKFRFPGHEQVQMVDSDLGPIPEGWEVISLGQLLDIKHGYAFKGEYFSKEPTSDILLTPGNFKFGGGFKDDKLKYYDGSVPKEFVLNPGDLLVTMTDLSKEGDTLGYPAFVPPSKELRFLHNQRLGKISLHNPKLGFNHLYNIFCSDSYRHHVLASATGSTVKHTAPDRIKSFSIALPTQEICNRFEMITSSWTRKIVLLNQKNANLRKTRDLLLPRLISGEIDVENLDINTGSIAA